MRMSHQTAMLDVVETAQPIAEDQDARRDHADALGRAERKALRDAKAGRISFEEYWAIQRQAGRAGWAAALGEFGPLFDEAS